MIGETTTGYGWNKDSYTATIDFAPTIGVPGPAPELFEEGFEWPPVATYWRFDREPNSTFELDSGGQVGGLSSLKSSLIYGDGRTQSAVWITDLSGHAGDSDLFVEFWARKFDESGELHVDLSGDGETWYDSVFSSPLSTDYQAYAFDLDAVAADEGVVLDGDVYLRFRHRNTYAGRFARLAGRSADGRRVAGTRLAVPGVSFPENTGSAATTAVVRRSATLDYVRGGCGVVGSG